MAYLIVHGLPISQEKNIFRIHWGQDIGLALRIQLSREQRKMRQEIDARQAKARTTAVRKDFTKTGVSQRLTLLKS